MVKNGEKKISETSKQTKSVYLRAFAKAKVHTQKKLQSQR